jgi:hypothetical protein
MFKLGETVHQQVEDHRTSVHVRYARFSPLIGTKFFNTNHAPMLRNTVTCSESRVRFHLANQMVHFDPTVLERSLPSAPSASSFRTSKKVEHDPSFTLSSPALQPRRASMALLYRFICFLVNQHS